MNNNKFWEAYKAKCSEKGLSPLYENAEDFNKAMTEPPKPYSTDDFTPSKDEGTQDNDDDFEHMLYLMQQSSGFVEDEYHEESTKEEHVETVKPKVCACCQEPKSDDAFGTLRNGELRNICKACHGKKISLSRCKIKEVTPITKELEMQTDHSTQIKARKDLSMAMGSDAGDDKVAIMKLSVFHAALGMAYERGVAEGKTFADLTITEVELPVILDEVLGERA